MSPDETLEEDEEEDDGDDDDDAVVVVWEMSQPSSTRSPTDAYTSFTTTRS